MARTPIHPGEHLAEQLKALDMSAAELARRLAVPTNRVTAIIKGQRVKRVNRARRRCEEPDERETRQHRLGSRGLVWCSAGTAVLDERRTAAKTGRASAAYTPDWAIALGGAAFSREGHPGHEAIPIVV